MDRFGSIIINHGQKRHHILVKRKSLVIELVVVIFPCKKLYKIYNKINSLVSMNPIPTSVFIYKFYLWPNILADGGGMKKINRRKIPKKHGTLTKLLWYRL